MITKAVMILALVIFIVLHVLKSTGNFNYEWIWVFAPLLYGLAIIWASSLR